MQLCTEKLFRSSHLFQSFVFSEIFQITLALSSKNHLFEVISEKEVPNDITTV